MVLKAYLNENPPDCPILRNWFFDNFILVKELFAKALRSLGTLCGKLFPSLESPTTFDEIFKVTSVPFLFLILFY